MKKVEKRLGKLTKKEGREWLALSLAGFESHKVVAGVSHVLKLTESSSIELFVDFVESEVVELREQRGNFAGYDGLVWSNHSNLLSGNYLPDFYLEITPVSQIRVERSL